jgi:SAM-dependent methyltransferase
MSTDASWVGGMPEAYDRLLGPVKFTPYARELVQRAAAFRPREVLELAAGTGLLTRELVSALPGARVVATDLNSPMVAWGSEHVVGAAWSQADALALTFDDESFDLVACGFGVMFFPDRRQGFREARRVLRPGGALVFSVWDAVEEVPFTRDLYEELVVLFPEDPPDFFVRIPYGYHDADTIQADLTSAGFADIVIGRVQLTTSAPSAGEYVDGYCYGTPLRFALEEKGDLGEIARRLRVAMTARWGTGPIEQRMSAYLVTAT